MKQQYPTNAQRPFARLHLGLTERFRRESPRAEPPVSMERDRFTRKIAAAWRKTVSLYGRSSQGMEAER
jgi:hypothetical protein